MQLCHIIATRRTPAEIREATVPKEQAATKLEQLRKQFDTVFVYRQFQGEMREVKRA